MKYVYLLMFSFLFASQSSHAQVQINYAMLDANNVKIAISANGSIGLNPAFPKGSWMPADDTAGTIYDSTPWIAGLNEQNDTLIAHQYANIDDYSWKLGPLTNSGTADSAYSTNFNHVWKITMDEINTHVNYFQSLANNTTAILFPNGYTIPSDFLTWPAHGDVSLGYDLYLAPFHDYNSDGIYNPNDGDYPTICGDQCLYFITNDVGQATTPRMGMQLETWVYAFNTPNNAALNNTFFTKYKFTNKSSHTYHNTRVSQMNDLDIGNQQNDYVATDIAYGAVYGYNGSLDNDGIGSTSVGYGDRNPIESVMLLAGPRLDVDFQDNALYANALAQDLGSYANQGLGFGDGIADNERSGLAASTYYNVTNNPVTGSPTTTFQQYYNLMVGKHRNGSIISNTLTGNAAPYWAPGNSDVSHERIPASENFTNLDLNVNPNDMRIHATTEAFTFEAGTHDYMDMAFVFALPDANSTVTVDSLNRQYLNAIRHFFNANLVDCQDLGTPLGMQNLTLESPISIYPNPADNALHIVISEALLGQTYRLYNNVGQLVLTDTLRATQTEVGVSSLAAGTYLMFVGMERRLVVVE